MKRTPIVNRTQLPTIVHMFRLSTIVFMRSASCSSPESNFSRAWMNHGVHGGMLWYITYKLCSIWNGHSMLVGFRISDAAINSDSVFRIPIVSQANPLPSPCRGELACETRIPYPIW